MTSRSTPLNLPIALSLAVLGLGIPGTVLYPLFRLESLFRQAATPGTTFRDGQEILSRMRSIRPDLVGYLRRKAESGDLGELESLATLLRRHPGLDRFCTTIIDAESEGPPGKATPDPEAEGIVRLYLDLLSAHPPGDPSRIARVHATALNLFAQWTGAPRFYLGWTRLDLYTPPNSRVWSPGRPFTPADLAAELSACRKDLDRTRDELARWVDRCQGKFVFGRFAFDEDGIPKPLEPLRIVGAGLRFGFCRAEDQSFPILARVGGAR